MISAKDARQFVIDTDSTWHTQIMDAIINALYHGRLHADITSVGCTESEIEWLKELGYTVNTTCDGITMYWV